MSPKEIATFYLELMRLSQEIPDNEMVAKIASRELLAKYEAIMRDIFTENKIKIINRSHLLYQAQTLSHEAL